MKYFIPIIILSLFLLGCKKDDDSSTTTTELEGTWKTPCFASGTAYRTKSLIVTGTTLVDTTNIYSDFSIEEGMLEFSQSMKIDLLCLHRR